MIRDALQLTYEQNKGKQPLFVRNLLKEQLQYYVLNFVYNSTYAENFLFKGGTCLRFCFELPRLSEDLDFDVENFEAFDIDQFISDIETYFKSKLQYNDFTVTVSGSQKLIYLKFPILRKIGVAVSDQKPSEGTLFVRIDLAPVKGKFFKKELSLKSTYDFSFLIRRYSLPDLFAGKVAAILRRENPEEGGRTPRFKGRDFFDIWWLKEKHIAWNSAYLSSLVNLTSGEEIKEKVNAKILQAVQRKSELKADLLPYFDNPAFVEDFINNLEHLSIST